MTLMGFFLKWFAVATLGVIAFMGLAFSGGGFGNGDSLSQKQDFLIKAFNVLLNAQMFLIPILFTCSLMSYFLYSEVWAVRICNYSFFVPALGIVFMIIVSIFF